MRGRLLLYAHGEQLFQIYYGEIKLLFDMIMIMSVLKYINMDDDEQNVYSVGCFK